MYYINIDASTRIVKEEVDIPSLPPILSRLATSPTSVYDSASERTAHTILGKENDGTEPSPEGRCTRAYN
jgi:hypothetical protein